MFRALLHKVLFQVNYLMEPVGFLWLCLIFLAVALWLKRQRGLASFTTVLVVFVTIIGSTSVPGRLLGSLERPYAGVNLDELPKADAIVLLGGGAAPSRYEAAGVHLTVAGDRIVMAHALYQKGKAPVILLGGNANKLDGVIKQESEIVRGLITTWGVPDDALIPLGTNQDTHDEALKVQKLATERGWNHVLLVTSANHLRRAVGTFEALGLQVTPVPCNFLTTVATAPGERGFSVPRHDGFVKISTWLHEEIGLLVYQRRGWIKREPRHTVL